MSGVILTVLVPLVLFFHRQISRFFNAVGGAIKQDPTTYIYGFIIVVILVWLYFINKKIKALSKANISGLARNFKSFSKALGNLSKKQRDIMTNLSSLYNNKHKNYEKLEPDDEIRYILRIVANSEYGKMKETSIKKWYFRKFTDNVRGDFRMVFDLLIQKGFLEQERGKTGYGGSYEELPLRITSKGYAYLRCRKIDDKETDKKE